MTHTDYISLVERINHLNHRYYVEHVSEVSDREFDALMRQLQEVENNHPDWVTSASPTQHVGSDLSPAAVPDASAAVSTKLLSHSSTKLVHHAIPMLSIANTYNQEELTGAVKKFQTSTITIEWKVDGCSLSVLYIDGHLRTLSTRGDGTEGTDITHHLPDIADIPQSIPYKGRVEIRGEVYMTYVDFNRYNASHSRQMANPRNACAGLIGSDQPCGRYLSFMAYYADGIDCILSQSGLWEHLPRLGFVTPAIKKLFIPHAQSSILGAELYSQLSNLYSSFPKDYPIDGLVLKVDTFSERQILGATSKYPNWAIAYKFKAQNQATTLRRVEWQVGATGQLTPVAYFDPIPLAGTQVQRATLNNWQWIMTLTNNTAPHIGDTVYVEKGGEIIPKVTRIDITPSSRGAIIFPPANCPECGEPIIQKGSNHYCPNTNCPARMKAEILHFASKDCMDIKGIGPTIVNELWEDGVRDWVSLYEWAYCTEVTSLSRNMQNVHAAVMESRLQPAWRLLHAIHIPGVGKAMSKQLISRYGSIDAIMRLSVPELLTIKGIGEQSALAIYNWGHGIVNQERMKRLERSGILSFSSPTEEKVTSSAAVPDASAAVPSKPLSHSATKLILVSGNFGTPARRRQIEEQIEASGHRLASGVSSGMDLLIIPDEGIDAWSAHAGSKWQKIQKLGYQDRVITESQAIEKGLITK